MTLFEIRTILAELEFRLEQLQKHSQSVTNTIVRLQIQAEEITKGLEKIHKWARSENAHEFDKFVKQNEKNRMVDLGGVEPPS